MLPFKFITAASTLLGLVSGAPTPTSSFSLEAEAAAAAATVVDKRAATRVVSAGSPAVIDSAGVYIRVTSTTSSSDGTLLAGYAARDGTQQVLRTARSTDGGKTWKKYGEVYRAAAAGHDIDNAFPLRLASGRILYAYRNHDRIAGASGPNGYSRYRITISYSDDGGKSFKYLSTVVERKANGYNGLWEPLLRVANDGSLQCYYSAEHSSTDQDGYLRRSTDGGLTWSGPITVSGSGVTSRDGMIGVAKINNSGKLMAVFENTASGFFSIDSVVSTNDGLSWGSRKRVYTALNGGEAIAPQIINVGGALVVGFMTDESTGANGADGAQMKVVTSGDGGNTWTRSALVGEAASHWPGLYARDTSHFLALYSRGGFGAVSQLYQLAN